MVVFSVFKSFKNHILNDYVIEEYIPANELSILGKSLCVLRLLVYNYVSMVRFNIESLKQRRFASVRFSRPRGLVRTHNNITHYDDDDDDDDSNNNNNIIIS